MTTLRRVRLLTLLIATLAVAACGGATRGPIVIPDTPAAGATSSTAPIPAASSGNRGLPVRVDVPTIGVHTTNLLVTGLNPDKSPSTPPVNKPQVLGVYGYGSPPCSSGSAMTVPFVLIGHIDGAGQQGVFVDLKNIRAGDTVTVKLDSGSSCTYRIDKLASFKKRDLAPGTDSAAAAKEIWGPVSQGSIRLISCGGKFVGAPLFYEDNLVAEGRLVS